jgi:hypothetical protein
MPYKNKADRKYNTPSELAYEHRDDQVKKRNERKRARYALQKAGKVHPNDGMDVDHIKPLSKGGKNVKANERVVPASTNRSFARTNTHALKSQVSTRERKKK